MKFNLSGKEVAEFQGALMFSASEEEASGIIDEYAQRLVERTPSEEDQGGIRFGLDTARGLLRGLKPVSKEVYRERLGHCASCEHVRVLAASPKKPDARVLQCGLCLCIMNAKAMVIGGKCPDGRF